MPLSLRPRSISPESDQFSEALYVKTPKISTILTEEPGQAIDIAAFTEGKTEFWIKTEITEGAWKRRTIIIIDWLSPQKESYYSDICNLLKHDFDLWAWQRDELIAIKTMGGLGQILTSPISHHKRNCYTTPYPACPCSR